MSNKDRICVAVFHRQAKSIGEENRARYGQGIYHWAILIRPKDVKQIDKCACFDATDGFNPTKALQDSAGAQQEVNQEWWFRSRRPYDPFGAGVFIGAVIVGKLPKNVSIAKVQSLLETVPLPLKDQEPKQNCVTWVRDAIIVLRNNGYVSIGPDAAMPAAIELGDGIIRDGPPASIDGWFRNLTERAA